jgi:hypothetical protein
VAGARLGRHAHLCLRLPFAFRQKNAASVSDPLEPNNVPKAGTLTAEPTAPPSQKGGATGPRYFHPYACFGLGWVK